MQLPKRLQLPLLKFDPNKRVDCPASAPTACTSADHPHTLWFNTSRSTRSMKGIKLRKSWDDVFPDGHLFSMKTHEIDIFNPDAQDILARHWRSNSASETEKASPHKFWSQAFRNLQKKSGASRKEPSNPRLASLEKDVAELRGRFEDEQIKKRILEKALQKASSAYSLKDCPSEAIQHLIEEIAILELEVTDLERHLLRLYRQVFTYCHVSSAHRNQLLKSSASKTTQAEPLSYHPFHGNKQGMPQKSLHLIREDFQRHAIDSGSLNKAWTLHPSRSQPIPLPQVTPCQDNLAKCSMVSKQRPLAKAAPADAANHLSEDLVRCMAAIYCKVAQPPIQKHKLSVSRSSSSSASAFSDPRSSSIGYSSQCKNDALKEWSCNKGNEGKDTTGTTSALEIRWICIDNEKLADTTAMLQDYRSLVQQLDSVDPSRMDYEQKLAFWINIHNALIMHAYLVYGIPRNQLKRVSLFQKAAYRIGTHEINAQTIAQKILKCGSYRPAKWRSSFLSPPIAAVKSNWIRERKQYAVQYREPLICFALCCGGRSDPVVRVYSHKLIFFQLERAKQEFLHANVSVHQKGRLCLPSILDSFAKETSMKPIQLLEWIKNHIDDGVATFIDMCLVHAKARAHRCIEWMQYDFTFRYLLANPLEIS